MGKDVVFPTDAELKLPVPDSPLKLYKKRSLAGPHGPQQDQARRFTPPQEYLRKDRRPGVKGRQRTRELIKFEPLDPYTQSDSDDDEELKKGVPPFVRSPTRSDSMATLADEQPTRKIKDDPLSEDEQDVTANRTHFLQRHDLARKASSVAVSQAGTGSSATLTSAAFTPVPATPSLIKAVERVNAAQREVFSRSTDGLPLPSSIQPTSLAPPAEPRPHNWNAFWDDVKTKAGHGFYPHRRDGAVDGASGAAAPKR